MNALSIVDSHVHLWDPGQFHYSWLDALPQLKRPFFPTDFSAASAAVNVSKLIFIECGCEPAQNEAEVDWAAGLAKKEPRLSGIVANASLEKGTKVYDELEALSRRPLVKGVRRALQGEREPEFCLSLDFIAGVELLAQFGFTFDLCIRAEQLREVSELAGRVSQVTFVLDHVGKPEVRARSTEPWTADLKRLARLPNVVCKLSGLATEADWKSWRLEDFQPYFSHALDCFGFERVLFGSDWPVATLATSYAGWFEAVEKLVSSVTEAERLRLFQTNAEKVYHV